MKKTTDQIKDQKKQTAKSGARPKPAAYAYPITVSDEDSERFQEAILRWNGLAREALEMGQPHIGLLGEKSLHSILKEFISGDPLSYETPIRSEKENDKHRYVADICDGKRIFEIQTGGFYPLIPKITYYLNETEYDVTVVHPIPRIRYRIWVDPETGEAAERKRSPKKGRAEDALKEIFWLRDLLLNPRLHITLLFLEEEEYRYLDGWSRDKKRGSNRCERVPAALFGRVELSSAADYRAFLPPALPEEFTASELGKCLGLRGKAIYSALKVLLATAHVKQIGTRGRSALYARCDV